MAAAFRHNPDEDGMLIPASTLIEGDGGRGRVMPVIGYLAYLPEGSNDILWSFVKYEAPDSHWPQDRRPSTRGQIATTRVANIHCSSCGHSDLLPLRGDGSKSRCPACGAGGVDTDPIKENSDELQQMLGDLRDPLEQACRSALSSGIDFEFPQVLVTATGLGVSSSVPAAYAGKISAAGYGVKDIREISSFQEMLDLWDRSPAISITPDICSGVVDSDTARRGASQTWPVFSHWLKLWLPERRRSGGVPFRTVRF